MSDRRYARFPEIIEFYSGIDRRRTELLKRLRDDLADLNESVNRRIGISADFNPYDLAKWSPSHDRISRMQKEIDDQIARSGLPVAVKDELADRNYDRTRPYRQELVPFMEDTSLYEALQVMQAAATALRNSDYVDTALKRELLDEVVSTGLILLRLLVVLTPMLVANRTADFDNVRFVLANHKPDRDPMEYIASVLFALPENVVTKFEKNLGSRRMAPLFSNLSGGPRTGWHGS